MATNQRLYFHLIHRALAKGGVRLRLHCQLYIITSLSALVQFVQILNEVVFFACMQAFRGKENSPCFAAAVAKNSQRSALFATRGCSERFSVSSEVLAIVAHFKICVSAWPDFPVVMVAVIVVRQSHRNANWYARVYLSNMSIVFDLPENKIPRWHRLPWSNSLLTIKDNNNHHYSHYERPDFFHPPL